MWIQDDFVSDDDQLATNIVVGSNSFDDHEIQRIKMSFSYNCLCFAIKKKS